MTTLTVNSIREIEEIKTVSEAANINRHAKAAAEIYKAQDNHEMCQWAKRIYLESARRAGQLLLETDRQPGVRSHELTNYQEIAEGAGISRFMAHTWQKLATIDKKTLEAYLDEAKYQGTEYTINGLLSYANGKRESVYTQESMLKVIEHWTNRYLDDFPNGKDLLVQAFWRIVGGEWS